MQPVSEFPVAALARIRVLAADVDDTITRGGKIRAPTVQWLVDLAGAGVTVAIVTGRPAGWAQALAGYLPGVRVAVAENGLVAFTEDGSRIDLGPERGSEFQARLATNAAKVRDAYGLSVTPDDTFRLFERAFVRPASFDVGALAAGGRLVDPDFEVVASSIHIHVRPAGWEKADGLLAALQSIDPQACAAPDDFILFVGDSSNDRSLFRKLRHTSIGVKNVAAFIDELGADQPAYVTKAEAAEGFAEIARALLAARSTGS